MSNVTNKLDKVGLSQVWGKIVKLFVAKEEGKGLSTNDFDNILKAKLDSIAENAQVNVIESVSVNGVALDITEKGVNIVVPTGTLADLDEVGLDQLNAELKAIIQGKADAATTLAGYGITDAYTKEEANAAIKTAVDAAVSGVYRFKGSIMLSELPTEGMKVGDTYNIKEAFVTTDVFLEGAGISYPAGTNVSYTEGGWDCLAGIYDFSEFLMKSDIVDITSAEIDEICVIG